MRFPVRQAGGRVVTRSIAHPARSCIIEPPRWPRPRRSARLGAGRAGGRARAGLILYRKGESTPCEKHGVLRFVCDDSPDCEPEALARVRSCEPEALAARARLPVAERITQLARDEVSATLLRRLRGAGTPSVAILTRSVRVSQRLWTPNAAASLPATFPLLEDASEV